MNAFKKVLYLIFLTFSIKLIASCCHDETFTFNWTDFNYLRTNTSGNKLDSIPWDRFGLKLTFGFNRLAANLNFGFTRSLGNNCQTFYGTDNKIMAIKIITLMDYDDTKKAGNDITDYSKVQISNPGDPGIGGSSIAEKINEVNANPTDSQVELHLSQAQKSLADNNLASE